VCAVNHAEILIGPLRAACGGRARSYEPQAAGRLALATAIHAEHRGLSDVRLASFDDAVLEAHAELHPAPRT
jgi:hypothetical protein